jgi:hypothetical protein
VIVKSLDKVFKNGFYYLLLHAVAQSNWNVQSWCGATKDHTIIWLKLDENLRPKDKKTVSVTACKSGIFMIDPKSDDFDVIDAPPKLHDGRVVVWYGNNDDYSDKNTYFELSYDRRYPEKGIPVITRSKKAGQ